MDQCQQILSVARLAVTGWPPTLFLKLESKYWHLSFFSVQLLSFFLSVVCSIVNVACWLLEYLLLLQDDDDDNEDADADDDYYLLGVWTFSMSLIYKMILAALQLLLLQSEPSLRSTLNHAPACTCRVWHSSWNSQQQQQQNSKIFEENDNILFPSCLARRN